jgi:hypothetical protein
MLRRAWIVAWLLMVVTLAFGQSYEGLTGVRGFVILAMILSSAPLGYVGTFVVGLIEWAFNLPAEATYWQGGTLMTFLLFLSWFVAGYVQWFIFFPRAVRLVEGWAAYGRSLFDRPTQE